jgi:hypothetical protein
MELGTGMGKQHKQQQVLLCDARCSEQNNSLSECSDFAKNTFVCLLLQHQASSLILKCSSSHPRRVLSHMQHQHSRDKDLGFGD